MDGLLLTSLVLLLVCNAYCLSNYSFPSDFSFGAGVSAYQTEGAVADYGKSENIWDYAIKQDPTIIEDGSNADTAEDSFYHLTDDLDSLIEMNVNHYKFSIPWSRVLPEGVYMNETEVAVGIGHYQYFINSLFTYNITPIVTFYHWDLPQVIQEWGGWTNASTIDLFVDYVDRIMPYLFEANYFITFHEPKQICKSGYGDGILAPFIKETGTADYQCIYNVLKAHAAVYKLLHEKYSNLTENKVSISLDGSWSQPKTDSDADKEAAERRNNFEFLLYADPIIKGNWPQSVIDRVAERSTKENLPDSRLPEFTTEEKADLEGSIDFIALNYYDTRLVADVKEALYNSSSYDNDIRVEVSTDPSWTVDTAGNTIVPSGIRSFLKYVKDNYGDIEILITGNGVADETGTTHDTDRVTYLSEYLSNVVDAITEDEVNVIGYTYWELIDSFEWTKGYKPHFGLYGVDLVFDNGTRYPKRSAEYYKRLISEKKVIDPEDLATTTTSTTTVETTTSTTTSTTSSTTTSATASTTTSTTTSATASTTTVETTTSSGEEMFNFITIKLLIFVLVSKLFFI